MTRKTIHDGERVPTKTLDAVERFLAGTSMDTRIAFTESLGNLICEQIAQGSTYEEIGAREGMPSKWMLKQWETRFPEHGLRAARAREFYADTLVKEALTIADDKSGDVKVTEKGNVVADWENVQRSKLRVETRKWKASKLAPHKYGDKLALTQEVLTQAEQSLEQRMARLKEIVAEYSKRGGDTTALLTVLGFAPIEQAGAQTDSANSSSAENSR